MNVYITENKIFNVIHDQLEYEITFDEFVDNITEATGISNDGIAEHQFEHIFEQTVQHIIKKRYE